MNLCYENLCFLSFHEVFLNGTASSYCGSKVSFIPKDKKRLSARILHINVSCLVTINSFLFKFFIFVSFLRNKCLVNLLLSFPIKVLFYDNSSFHCFKSNNTVPTLPEVFIFYCGVWRITNFHWEKRNTVGKKANLILSCLNMN